MNNGFEVAEKVPWKELRKLKMYYNKKPLAYNKTTLFTGIIKKNLEELKNNDKIKEILDTTKVIKSLRQPKNLKRILTLLNSGKTQHKELPNAKIKDEVYVII